MPMRAVMLILAVSGCAELGDALLPEARATGAGVLHNQVAAQLVFGDKFSDGSALANLSSTLTINGNTLTPWFSYDAVNLTGGDSAAWTDAGVSGVTMSKVEVGTNVSAALDTLLQNTTDKAGYFPADYVRTASGGELNITTEDFALEGLVEIPPSAAELINNLPAGAGAYWRFSYTGAALQLDLWDGAVEPAPTCAVAAGGWYHFLALVDRSVNSTAGAVVYCNGTVGTGANPSTLGTLNSTNKNAIGARQNNGAGPWTARIAFVRGWKCASCLDNSDLTEEAALAKVRAIKAMGGYPEVAGTFTPTTITRATTATLQKYTAGVSSLFLVGNNWIRNVSNASATGLLFSPTVSNLALQSQDLATSWSLVTGTDTLSLNSVADPLEDNASKGDGIVGTVVVDVEHGVTQAITLTAATYAASAFYKPGAVSWAYLCDDTIANGCAYMDAGNCANGTTKGAGVSSRYAENYGNGWCRVGITFTGTAAAHTIRFSCAEADNDKVHVGDGATVECSIWGMQVELMDIPTSFIPTTTASAARHIDRLQFSTTGNATALQGSAVASFWLPNFNITATESAGNGLIEVSNGVADQALLYVWQSGDACNLQNRSGSVTQASPAGTTDVANGAVHTCVDSWATNDVRVFVDGLVEGTPDTSATSPGSGITSITLGAQYSFAPTSALNGILREVRIYSTPGVTR